MRQYDFYIFDCDGVILDSNRMKGDAFAAAVKRYGQQAESAIRAFHSSHGGVSRHSKFRYFFEEILGKNPGSYEREFQESLDIFANYMREELFQTSVVEGFEGYIAALPAEIPKFVISAANQDELLAVLSHKGFTSYFAAILGGPTSKKAHLSHLLAEGLLRGRGLFIGDSQTDFEAARSFDLEFVFLSQYTSMLEWEAFCRGNAIRNYPNFIDLHRCQCSSDVQSKPCC